MFIAFFRSELGRPHLPRISHFPYPASVFLGRARLSECSVLDLAPAGRDKKTQDTIDESKFKVYSNYYFLMKKYVF